MFVTDSYILDGTIKKYESVTNSSGNRHCVDVTQISPSFDGSIPDPSSGDGISSLSDKSTLNLLLLFWPRSHQEGNTEKKAKRMNALLSSEAFM